jgi:hypothetical protein
MNTRQPFFAVKDVGKMSIGIVKAEIANIYKKKNLLSQVKTERQSGFRKISISSERLEWKT